MTHENDAGARRLEAAQEVRNKAAVDYDAASGSNRELPAYTELQAAEERVTAREAWVQWVESDY
jgi:hypothetical protein